MGTVVEGTIHTKGETVKRYAHLRDQDIDETIKLLRVAANIMRDLGFVEGFYRFEDWIVALRGDEEKTARTILEADNNGTF